jgi:hypothetical protein
MNRDQLIDLLVECARYDLGRREKPGKKINQGDWIAKLWQATSYPDGMANAEPYCAAGMCWVLKFWLSQLAFKNELAASLRMTEAQAERWRPKSAKVWDWMDWARKAKGVALLPKIERPQRGDVMIFDSSHTGLVTEVNEIAGSVYTIEYNTGNGSTREGDGCHEKERPWSYARAWIRLLPEAAK